MSRDEDEQVQVQVSHLPGTRLVRSRLARREKVLLRLSGRLPRLKNCSKNDNSTAIIPRTSERNSSLPIAPPVPLPVFLSLLSLFLPSCFASHPGACSPLPCLLACKSTWNQFDQSRSTCATGDQRETRQQNTPPTTYSSPRIPPSYKRPNGGGRQSSMLSVIAVVSNAR